MSIRINPHKAYLTRDTEVMSQMDPFIELTLGNQKCKTKTLQEGGKKVLYDEQFSFNPEGNNLLKVTVYDEDEMTNDEVGTGEVDLTNYFRGKSGIEYISLKYNNKPAGKVILKIVQNNQSLESLSQFTNRNQPIKFFTPEDIMKELAASKMGSRPPQMGNQFQQQQSFYPQQNMMYSNSPQRSTLPPVQTQQMHLTDPNPRHISGYYQPANRS